jgi:UPF0755 protein
MRHQRIRTRANRLEQKSSSKIKKVAYFTIFFLLLQFIYFGLLVTPGTEPENSVTITVEPGEGLKSIANDLKEANVINSKTLFLAYAKLKDFDTKIQSGVFRVPLPQNMQSILKLLTEAPQEEKITVPEGLKISQIDDILAEKGLIQAGEFIDCIQNCPIDHPLLQYIPTQSVRNLEGFLYPDTYFISSNAFQIQDLILKMLDNFESKLPQDWESKVQQLPFKSLYEAINMASIIEREVLSKKDKQLVSGILWKRIENDWTIGADATLLYLKSDNDITSRDLVDDNPYNSRVKLGLPPTPISNPGLSSIEAALNPINSEYWFYITTLDTGEVKYAVTYEEHNRNIDRYLR